MAGRTPHLPEVVPPQPGLEIRHEGPFPEVLDDRLYNPPAYQPIYQAASEVSYAQFVGQSYEPSEVQLHKEEGTSSRGKWFNRRSFPLGFLVGSSVATFIMAAVLGGVLGARMSSCEAKIAASSTSNQPPENGMAMTSSSNSTQNSVPGVPNSMVPSTAVLASNYTPFKPSQVDTLFNDCDPRGSLGSNLGDLFLADCGFDYGVGRKAAEGGVVADIIGIIAYSFLDCLSACSELNKSKQQNGFPTKCRALAWSPDLKNMTISVQSNCWLKNGTLAKPEEAAVNPHIMGARLKTPG